MKHERKSEIDGSYFESASALEMPMAWLAVILFCLIFWWGVGKIAMLCLG
jgi:hypothetical protein